MVKGSSDAISKRRPIHHRKILQTLQHRQIQRLSRRTTLRNAGAQSCQKGLDVLESPPLVSLSRKSDYPALSHWVIRKFSSHGWDTKASPLIRSDAALPSFTSLPSIDSRLELNNRHTSGRPLHPVHPPALMVSDFGGCRRIIQSMSEPANGHEQKECVPHEPKFPP
jgi:hypothetical protein